MKINITNEVISEFLEGKDNQKNIIAIEATYGSNIASMIINDPKSGKYIEKLQFRPFLWIKHEVSKYLYGGDRGLIKQAMVSRGISMKLLTTADANGFTPKRMDNGYKYLVSTSGSFSNLLDFFKDGGIDPKSMGLTERNNPKSPKWRDLFMMASPTEQFMIQTGKRLFKGMDDYDDLHRLQFDLETTGVDKRKDTIFQIGVRDNRGFEYIIEVTGDDAKELRENERSAIRLMGKIIDDIKPDVITGYNSEDFDWDFIEQRCDLLSINLKDIFKGLNGSPLYRTKSSIKLGGESQDYLQAVMWGTNILDISHAVRKAMAINSEMKSWSLKYITKFSKIVKPNRVYVPGNLINKTWADKINQYIFNDLDGDWVIFDQNNIEHLEKLNNGYEIVSGSFIVQRYLLDDLWETEKVDGIYNQASFLLSKIIPTSFMRSSTMGTASIWKLIMMAWSYENGLAVPEGQPQKTFTGGLSRLLEVGFAKNVVKLDYAALYPNTEITHDIFPDIDISGVMKGLLIYIAETRDEYKALKGVHGDLAKKLQSELDESINNLTVIEIDKLKSEIKKHQDLSSMYDKKQLPIKILANSFFGSFGAPHIFPWGDIDCAEETTCRGRQYLRLMVKFFHGKYGFRPLVGDSVTHDTPIYIKNKFNDTIDILPICDLFNEKSNNLDKENLRDYEDKPYEVLTRNGWKNIKYVYRHGTDKNIHRITTKDRLINVTEDHSLFQNGIEVKPSTLIRGDLIDTYEIPFNINKNIILNEDEAFLYGFFLGDGSSLNSKRKVKYISKKTGIVKTYLVKRSDWKISNTKLGHLERLQRILKDNFNINGIIKNHLKSSGVYNLVVHNSKFSDLFCEIFYTSYREKKIPKTILNVESNVKKAFIEGVFSSDGYGDTIETCSDIGMKSQIAMAGISLLLKELNLDYKIKTRKDKENFISFNLKNSNRNNSSFTIKTKKKTGEVWGNEIITNRDKNKYVYDISTEDGTFICGINGIIAHNTDGFNFAIPDNVDEITYYVTGNHRMTKEFTGQTLIGLKAVVAEFNEIYMEGRMGLDIDDVCNSTLNFSRKNYANDIGGKIKLVGNTIKSNKMPVYIEEFINKGVRLLLDGKGCEFIDLYYETVDNIVNYNIPLSKIASKARVKQTIDAYFAKTKLKNKAGNPMPRQAHMELIIANDLTVNLGDTIYYVNIGDSKSTGDIKSIKLENGQVDVQLSCKLISSEDVENNPNATTDEYNSVKYLDAFNTRIKPLLVCFQKDVRDKLVINLVKDRKTKEFVLGEKNYFTIKDCELTSGQPFEEGQQDDIEKDLMIMEDKEVDFWLRVDKVPNHIDGDYWVNFKNEYIERKKQERKDGINNEKELLITLFKKLEVNDYISLESGLLTPGLEKLIYIQPTLENDTVIGLELISKKWEELLFDFSKVYDFYNDAVNREKFYTENGHTDYDLWLESENSKIDNSLSSEDELNNIDIIYDKEKVIDKSDSDSSISEWGF